MALRWPGGQFGYGFDDIGNRQTTAAGGDQFGANLRYASYSANSLNQYTSRTVPGAVDMIGTATNTATVTVNNTLTSRKGTFYRAQLPVDNSAGPVFQSVTNLAVLNQGTNADVVTNATGGLLLPPASQTFSYDLDGNLTTDSVWNYVWDGENRLVQMSNVTALATSGRKKLDFVYDYQGRRVQKIVSTNSGSAWVAVSTNRFVYDGWNLVSELNGANNALLRSYMWGSDLSGSMQGAGGVGGLLKMTYVGAAVTNCFVAYDGNGNVAGLANAADGSTLAQYEYGPFGEVIRASGAIAQANPYRFSNKYEDNETAFLYYGYRYYNPGVGSWLSRDPLFESDTANLALFVHNNVVNDIDRNGLLTITSNSGWYTRCGTLAVGFFVTMDYPPPFDGYIVQHLVTNIRIRKCNRAKIVDIHYDFYEVLQHVLVRNPKSWRILDVNDYSQETPNSIGYIEVNREVVFIADTITKCLPVLWNGTHVPLETTGPISLTLPTWWSHSFDTKEYPDFGSYMYTWSCCCGNRKASLSLGNTPAQPGSVIEYNPELSAPNK